MTTSQHLAPPPSFTRSTIRQTTALLFSSFARSCHCRRTLALTQTTHSPGPHAAKAWQTTVVRLLLGLFLLPPMHIIIRLAAAAAVAAAERQLLICAKIKRHCACDVRLNVLERASTCLQAMCAVWPRTIASRDSLSYNSFQWKWQRQWMPERRAIRLNFICARAQGKKLINRLCSRKDRVSSAIKYMQM